MIKLDSSPQLLKSLSLQKHLQSEILQIFAVVYSNRSIQEYIWKIIEIMRCSDGLSGITALQLSF